MGKSLRITLSLLLWAAALTACNEDDKDIAPADIDVWQQYEVYISNGTAPAAFANMREGSASGRRLKLERNSLTCNTRDMIYTPAESDTWPEFNYAVQLEPNHRYAAFELKRGGRTLKNRIDIADIPALACPALTRIENGIEYPLDCAGIPEEFRVNVSLSPSQTNLNTDVVYAELDRQAGKFSFFGLKTGVYTLRVDVVRSQPTAQNDGAASGTLTAIRRSSTGDVQVPVETVTPL